MVPLPSKPLNIIKRESRHADLEVSVIMYFQGYGRATYQQTKEQGKLA